MPKPTCSKLMVSLLVLAIMATLATGTHAQSGPSLRPYQEMDYGRLLTASLEVATNNIAYKGVAIRLDQGPGGVAQGNAFVVFDTDLMRVAAGWIGRGFIDWKGIAFDGQHGIHPSIVGQRIFTTPVAPGWANPESGSFDEPRSLGLDQKPYGPLPRQWTHYQGLYVNGDDVILSYTVGETSVLEMPAIETFPEFPSPALIRTMQIGKSSRDLVVEVATDAGVAVDLLSLETLLPAKLRADATGSLAVLGAKSPATDAVTIARFVSSNSTLAWDTREPGHLRLRIPAAATPVGLKLMVARVPKERVREFATASRSLAGPPDLAALTKGGPARWTTTVKTRARLGSNDGAFAIDTLALPTENPWRSWMRPGGFDFFKDGRRAAVCTWQGDVWIVDGLGETSGELTWRRIAAGLFQPLGLKIVEEQIFVTGRDQITVLRDLNGDGETDFYHNFNNDAQVTEHFHEFAMDLQTDAAGHFYYAKGARHAKDALVPQHGTLIRVTSDGQKSEIVASGFRAPNGVCVNGDGTFVVSDQEGHWTPMNRINWIKPGGFYGNMGSYSPGRNPDDYEPPVCWIHKNTDRSPAEQLWVTSERWGSLRGALLSLSYGTGRIWNVLFEKSGERIQGGVIRLPLPELPTGIMRGRFSPQDGQLYVCGLVGWSSNKTLPGGFYRVRYTGKALLTANRLHATTRGVWIGFSDPLDPASAQDPQNYAVARWGYRRSAEYGSADYKLGDGTKGRDTVSVSGVKVSKDRRSVFLQIPEMRPVMQMQIQYDLNSADGKGVAQTIEHTIHFLNEPSEEMKAQFEGGL